MIVSVVTSLLQVIVHDLKVFWFRIGPAEATRHCLFIRMLCCPARSPDSFFNRLPRDQQVP
jgi:hypothetical protein